MLIPPKLKKEPALQFRAGKMKYLNGIVSPELQKGFLSFIPNISAGSVEVIWSGSESEVEDVFVWKKTEVVVDYVEKCTTGRVLLFKVTVKGKEKLHFFWLQDKSDAKDAQHLEKLKELFSGGSGTAEAAPSVQLEEFKRILAAVSSGNTANEVNLADLVSSKKVAEAVKKDPAFYKDRLKDTLPAELASSENILEQIKNPQVSQAAAVLEGGLSDPETRKVLCKMYGLPENITSVSGFVTAIINQANKTQGK